MSEKLKPCPFCGAAKSQHRNQGMSHASVSCDKCGASGPTVLFDRKDKYDVVTAMSESQWNRRTAIKWSSKPPTKPGFYWMICERGLHVVKIDASTGNVHGTFFIGGKIKDIAKGFPEAKWLKIEEPEVPR